MCVDKVKIKMLIGKAAAIEKAIATMDTDHSKYWAPQAVGTDYNRLVAVAKEVCPFLDDLLPPNVDFGIDSYNTVVSKAKYADIKIFASQIKEMLETILHDLD